MSDLDAEQPALRLGCLHSATILTPDTTADVERKLVGFKTGFLYQLDMEQSWGLECPSHRSIPTSISETDAATSSRCWKQIGIQPVFHTDYETNVLVE